MDPTRVIFLGPRGTYSHQAALQQFGTDQSIEYVPTKTIADCFDLLEQDHQYEYSVVPLENSTNGQVVFSYDLLRDRMFDVENKVIGKRVIPRLKVIGEQYVSIAHCLLTASPIVSIEELSQYKTIKIYSHPQVWGQVTHYLERFKNQGLTIQTIDASSTSEAVTIAKGEQSKLEEGNKDTIYLAIASETAAHLNNVTILQHSINDVLGNTTRFLVLQRQEDSYSQDFKNHLDEPVQVNLLSFTTEQDEPGSLVDVLNILKDHWVNMSSIHSRPYNSTTSPRKWQYVFFVEYTLDENKTKMEEFYNQIDSKCLQWCLWGTFTRNERYYQ